VGVFAGITVSVHFVLLTVGRQVNPAEMPGFGYLLSWRWPSVFFALEIVAWDLFFGLALLAVGPVFSGDRLGRWVRAGMIAAGMLCVFGLVGAVLGDMTIRDIGIRGLQNVWAQALALLTPRTRPLVDLAPAGTTCCSAVRAMPSTPQFTTVVVRHSSSICRWEAITQKLGSRRVRGP
jgi:hypothetical protein